MSNSKQTLRKLTIKDSSGRLETFHNVRFVSEHFMGKDWYLVIDGNDSILYNPDRVIFLDIKKNEEA